MENCSNSCMKFLKDYLQYDASSDESYFEEYQGVVYQKNLLVEESDILIKELCKYWMSIQSSLHSAVVIIEDFTDIRKRINQILGMLLENLILCKETSFLEDYNQIMSAAVKRLHKFICPLHKMDDAILLRIIASANNIRCPFYLYYHTYLDAQWLLLNLSYTCKKPIPEIEIHFQQIIKDLISISRISYKQDCDNALVFICACTKNVWWSLQNFMRTKYDSDMFWRQFNIIVKEEDPLFVLWLLKEIAHLYLWNINDLSQLDPRNKIVPNFALLESKLKCIILSTNELTLCLRYIEPLINNLWLSSSRIEIYQILWDYFSKKINVKTMDITDDTKSVVSYSELIDTILWCPKDCKKDFFIFTAFLLQHLQHHPQHWGKMKGRIYSQLNPHKIKDFSLNGIFNVMTLYICLSSLHGDELTKKIISVVECLPSDKQHSESVWNMYIHFMIRQVRDGKSIDLTSPVMLHLLEDAVDDQQKYWLVKLFMGGFEKLIENSQYMQLQQWLLINSWLGRYLSNCYYNDLTSSLDMLTDLIEKVTEEDAWKHWEDVYKKYIYPNLKQLANSRSAPGEVGKLAAQISLLCPDLYREAFFYFNNDNMNAKVTSQYLCKLLERYPDKYRLSLSEENIALKSWVKSCIFITTQKELTRNILKLEIFKLNCLPNTIISDIGESTDPFVMFLSCLGSNIQEYIRSTDIIKLCENCFGQTDLWITQYFTQPENEKVVMRIYDTLAVAFLKCGPLIYDRNKTTCPLFRLITALLLPTEFMIGKSLHPFILNSIRKTWQQYIRAIINLNKVPDIFLDRILRDLVVKYIPHFSSGDSPVIESLNCEDIASVILDKISISFFKPPTKESEGNVLKALKIVNGFVSNTTSLKTFKLVIEKCLYNLLENIICNRHTSVLVSVIINIATSPLSKYTQEDIQEVINNISEVHMMRNTNSYFHLMNTLAKYIPGIVKATMPTMERNLSNVEKRRGFGNDNGLRMHFEKLQSSLSTKSNVQ